jgi:hypothetical protein
MRFLFIMILASMLPVLFVAGSSGEDQSPRAFQERFGLPASPEKVLEEVLSGAEFQKSPLQDLWERILQRAGEMIRAALRWLFDRASGLGPIDTSADTLWTIAMCLLIGSVAVLFFYALMKLGQFLLGRRSSVTINGDGVPRSDSEALGLDQLRERARSASAAGNYGEAVIYLFRFALLWLDGGGRVALHPGKTNREILESMRADDAVRPTLGAMIPLFNRVRYGNRICTKAEYDGFTDLFSRVTEGK